jgi:parallel beta-helix repeat protein
MRTPILATICICLAAIFVAPDAIAAQLPGPSLVLYNTPYYKCVKNYYVSTTGSDSNAGTSSAAAWKTLQHANNAGRSAGDCVNVAPGTYNGVQLTKGGNLASSTGYVVYRCTTMDACTVNGTAGPNGNAAFFATGTGSANYVIIDGFEIVGNGTTWGAGVEINGTNDGTVGTFGSHHDWIFNSIIHGHGQSGIALAEGDYTYVIHNTIYDNAHAANCDSGAQGSGLADNVALDIKYGYPNYTPTADDEKNPSPQIGSFVTGPTWFHKAYMWNLIYNNYLTPCNGSKTADTDGNNIILDTFGTINGNNVAYPDQTLIAYNIVYNAGGGGIHIFGSEYATVANNSVYNVYLDSDNKSSDRASVDTNNSYGNTIINNIMVSIPAAPSETCAYSVVPYAQFASASLGGPPTGMPADTWSHNITQLQGGHNSCWGAFGENAPTGENPMFQSDAYSCSSNKCATNPAWVDVGKTSTGTEATPPVGANFALQPGSPAIGYGLRESYLPSTSVDVGACPSAFKNCP